MSALHNETACDHSYMDPDPAGQQDLASDCAADNMPRGSIGTVLSVIDQGVVSGTSFLSAVLVGRFCSQHELGTYAMALSILLVSRGVLGVVVSSPYLVYSQRRRGIDLSTYTGSSLLHLNAVTLAVMALLIALIVGVKVAGNDSSLVTTLASLAVAMPFVLLRDHLRQVSFAGMKLSHALVMDVGVGAVQLAWLGVLAWAGLLSGAAVYAGMALSCGIGAIAWFLLVRMPMKFRIRQARKDWGTNWEFGRWTLSSQLLSQGAAYLMPWVIAAIHGEAATGLMAACLTIVNLMGTFVSGVSNVLTPRAAVAYAESGHAALRRVLVAILKLYLVSVGFFCLFLLVTGDLLATMIYGPQYAGSGPILVVLGLQLLVNAIGITAGNGLWALDRPRANFLADVAMFTASALALAVLIHPLGVLGAAISLLCGTVGGTIVRCAMLLSQLEMRRTASVDLGGAA